MGAIREPKGVDFEINNSKGFSPADHKLMLAFIAKHKTKTKTKIHPLEGLRKLTQKATKRTGVAPKTFKRK